MKKSTSLRKLNQGLSLIELMVGITIGMVCIIVMFQVVNLWENTRRTTSTGSDAQITGSVASFDVDRDLKLAGMGFGTASDTQTGCPVAWQNSTLGLTAQTFALAPVIITQGASNAPDTITILHGDSSYFVANENIAASTTTTKKVSSQAGFRKGDLAVYAGTIAGTMTCELIQISDNSNADAQTLLHSSTAFISDYPQADGSAATAVASPYNSVGGSPAGFTTGVLFNLGPSPQLNRWEISGGNLQVTNLLTSTAASIVAENVVNLQAQYGMMNAGVLTWTETTPLANQWRNLKAIRFAMLIRSPEFEREAIYGAAPLVPTPTWTDGGGTAHAFTMTDVNGTSPTNSGDTNDWKHYRYRVYESTVVMRNMMWATI